MLTYADDRLAVKSMFERENPVTQIAALGVGKLGLADLWRVI